MTNVRISRCVSLLDGYCSVLAGTFLPIKTMWNFYMTCRQYRTDAAAGDDVTATRHNLSIGRYLAPKPEERFTAIGTMYVGM